MTGSALSDHISPLITDAMLRDATTTKKKKTKKMVRCGVKNMDRVDDVINFVFFL